MNRFSNLLLVVLIISNFLIGCASVPKASKENDLAAKQFKTTDGKANLYIFRDEQMGGAVRIDVDLDGKPIGKTAAMTFLMVPLNPGKHVIVSHAENDSTIEVNAEAGKSYYIWQEIKMGLMYARNKLQMTNELEAKSRILKCDLIDTAH